MHGRKNIKFKLSECIGVFG